MEVKYDVKQYITRVKMSGKKRILVEGRDDRAHIFNMMSTLKKGHKIKVDTAEEIRAIDEATSKNNRAKIEAVFKEVKGSRDHSNLHFLVDREFFKFDVSDCIRLGFK